MDTFTMMRLHRDAAYLHSLGPRAVAGFVHDLAQRIGGMPAALALLAEYRQRITPQMLRATGGDRFPPHLHVVPREVGR